MLQIRKETKEEIENLDYPLFKTTWVEKQLLRYIRRRLLKAKGKSFLCLQITKFPLWPLLFTNLLHKIMAAIYPFFSLKSFIRDTQNIQKWFEEDHYYLRVVWINKLLAYKGE